MIRPNKRSKTRFYSFWWCTFHLVLMPLSISKILYLRVALLALIYYQKN